MKKVFSYRHKQSHRIAIQIPSGNYILSGSPENIYLKDIIEDTNDWERLPIIPTDEDMNFPLFSFNDIIKMSSQNGHYRDFTTVELKELLIKKLIEQK